MFNVVAPFSFIGKTEYPKFGCTTVSIMTFSIMTLRIKTLHISGFLQHYINDILHSDTQHNITDCFYVECCFFAKCHKAECRYTECCGAKIWHLFLKRHLQWHFMGVCLLTLYAYIEWFVFKSGSAFQIFAPLSGNTSWRGRLSTVDLLIKIPCFVKKRK
jgi:hypothetical protein